MINKYMCTCPVCGRTSSCTGTECDVCSIPSSGMESCVRIYGDHSCECKYKDLIKHIIQQRMEIERHQAKYQQIIKYADRLLAGPDRYERCFRNLRAFIMQRKG